ncbi:hypothetical protein GLOIN_2v1791704 [Rhizophagus irregularis DAOM 181602=DAOM 197198]|nr:hypothetical protein GLOIN_2v1791704 [Rhizophagus irregularis DAOM 181602=DAOM 197198]
MGPKIIIICGVDGTGKTFIVNKLIKEFEKVGQSVRFNTFKRRREDNDKYKIPKKGIEWEFRKEVVEQINRRMEEHDNEDWLILDKSPYSEYFYQQTPSFDRGYITRYENHLLEKEVFRNKRIIDESIVIFLENEKCWENYKGREYSKKDQGHKTSYPLLDEERYMEMVKSFKECQDIYEGEKYANIKISNNDTDWERVYNKIIELDRDKPPIEVKNVEIKDNIRVTDGKKHIEKNGKNIRIIEDFEKMGALYLAHSHELSAHMGIKSTYDNLKDKYYWENMLNDVERYVRTLMDENIKEINLSDRIVGLLEELPKIRHEAKEQILKSQIKQKEYHDRKIIKEHTFGIGDKILLYDKAKAQQLSGKLESKWLGPFYIHEILPNGAYRIKNIKGVIKKIPVNGELLKTYHTPMSK